MIMKESMTMVVLGIATGVPATLAAGRLISSRLPDIRAVDPPTLCAAILMMLAVAALAAFVPARRAATLDPIAVLRFQ